MRGTSRERASRSEEREPLEGDCLLLERTGDLEGALREDKIMLLGLEMLGIEWEWSLTVDREDARSLT